MMSRCNNWSFFAGWLANWENPFRTLFRRMRLAWRWRGVTNKRISNARLVGELGFHFQFPNFPRLAMRRKYNACGRLVKTASQNCAAGQF